MRFFSAFLAMVRTQTTILTRYPVNFAAGLLVSFGGVLALALAIQMFAPAGNAPQAGASAMFYGYLLYLFLSDSLWRIGFSIRQEQLQGTFEGLYLTPAPKFASLIARVVPLFGLTLCGAVLALLGARLIFGALPLANPLLALAIFAGSLSGTLGFGFCFAAYTLLAGEAASALGNLLEFALLVFCAMLFPFHILPGPVRILSSFIPLSYCVDAFRSTLMGFPAGYPELAPLNLELWIIAAYGILSPLLGYTLYHQVVHHLREEGQLGQY